MLRPLLIALLCAASLAHPARASAQQDEPPAPPPPPALAQPPPEPAPGLRPPLAQHVPQEPPPPLRKALANAPADVLVRPARPPNYDTLSVYDAATLDEGQLAVAVAIGFPYALLRGGYGLLPDLDVGLGFNSLYGLVNQPFLFGKYRLKGDKASTFALAVRTDLEVAFFKDPPGSGERSRWLTGQRDFSIHPGVVLSTRTSRGLVFFTDVGLQVTFDTHPLSPGPLGGPGPGFTVGANAPLRMGLELPLSRHANFLALWGLDLHFRREDSTAMPYLELGVTFGG